MMLRFLVCLSEKEMKNLKGLADESGISVAEVLRRIIDEKFSKNQNK